DHRRRRRERTADRRLRPARTNERRPARRREKRLPTWRWLAARLQLVGVLRRPRTTLYRHPRPANTLADALAGTRGLLAGSLPDRGSATTLRPASRPL